MLNSASLPSPRHVLQLCLGAYALAASGAFAQPRATEPERVTGTIIHSHAQILTLNTGEKPRQAIRMNAHTKFVKRHPATLSDVKANSFVGVTAVEESLGKLVAKEIHIFPESMRGAGEGHHPMTNAATDDDSVTTMTNGNITTITNGTVGANGAAGQPMTLNVSYQGGTNEIDVLGNVAVTELTPTDASVLRPGLPAVAFVFPDAHKRPVALTIMVTTPN